MEWIWLKMFGSLFLVIALIFGTMWLLKKFMVFSTPATGAGVSMEIAGVLHLGPRRTVYAVKAGGQVILLGVSEHAITFLTRLADSNETLNDETMNTVLHGESATAQAAWQGKSATAHTTSQGENAAPHMAGQGKSVAAHTASHGENAAAPFFGVLAEQLKRAAGADAEPHFKPESKPHSETEPKQVSKGQAGQQAKSHAGAEPKQATKLQAGKYPKPHSEVEPEQITKVQASKNPKLHSERESKQLTKLQAGKYPEPHSEKESKQLTKLQAGQHPKSHAESNIESFTVRGGSTRAPVVKTSSSTARRKKAAKP